MRSEDDSRMGRNVRINPVMGAHTSRNLKINSGDPTTIIFDKPEDYNIYLSMFQSLPREKSSISGGGPGGANTLTYETAVDAQNALVLLQEAKDSRKK